ncbi:MAG TPA: 3-deoxy-D-manno-octulosonic acid transferase [Sedimentisphaerales bacterium]|nr:3-deoxy-D-manno-octulosonic acid transferase [Sedimentisphaerales bacterium]
MRYVLDLLYLFAGLTYSPVIVYRAIRHGRYRSGWAQRFGKISRRSPEKKCIWLHAVSVGEVNAAKTIIKELETRFSDFEIIISTTTDTGFARATNLFSRDHQVFYFPFDFSWAMHRAFGNIRPAICLLMELEIWPNFISLAKRLDVPVVVVNGRISDKSYAGYRRIKLFTRNIFGKISLVLAQTDQYAQRFREIGAGNVIVTSSLKYDTAQITDKVQGADALAAQINIGSERLWVAGGTGPGEEQIILDVFKHLKQSGQLEDLRLVIVPRKPERFDDVARTIADAGFDFIRYSSFKNTDAGCKEKPPVILGDTMGDLRKFYCLATIIFVGRSLVPMGGSDMMEAAALGKCTVFGPHAFNFRQTVDSLLAGNGAIMVNDGDELLKTMQKCLLEPDYAREIARNGQEDIKRNQGATTKSIEQIEKFLHTT